jgi:hypothetical protein
LAFCKASTSSRTGSCPCHRHSPSLQIVERSNGNGEASTRRSEIVHKEKWQRLFTHWAAPSAPQRPTRHFTLGTFHRGPKAVHLGAGRFTFSILPSGVSFAQVPDVFPVRGIVPPSRSSPCAVRGSPSRRFAGPVSRSVNTGENSCRAKVFLRSVERAVVAPAQGNAPSLFPVVGMR